VSGVVKGVGKVFKAVAKVVKKIAKPVLIGAAIYFTGGLALSAFPATAGFAASLPGFGISASGAATGIFSKAAAALGLQGGLVAGAAGNAAAAGAPLIAGAEGGAGAVMSGLSGGSSAASTLGAGITLGGGGGTAAAMSFTDKLLLASLGSKAVGAFLAPDLGDQYDEAKRWRGAFYGAYADGSSDPAPVAEPATAAPQPITGPAAPAGQAPEPVAAQSRELMPTTGQSQPRQTAQTTPAVGAAPGVTAPVENTEIVPRQLMQPGVRYVS